MDLYRLRNELNSGRSIYDLPLRVTYYARVSTDKDEQLHSLQAQISYYSEFIRNSPNWSLVDGYVDEGISGTSVKKRESFLRMIDDARLQKFDFIVTKEISRFSRNTLDSIRYTQQLLSCGVGVLFQSDNINTLMPDAELRLTIMSSIAQDEVRKTSERVRFGFKRAIEKGVVLGNSKIWGYRKEQGRLRIDEEEAKLVRVVFDMYALKGLGIRSICEKLAEQGLKNSRGNDFSFSTIRGILSNPKYKGYYCGGKTHKYDYRRNERKHMDQTEWTMYKDEETVPPIVSEELWNKANRILEKRGRAQSGEDKPGCQNQYPYSGKIICTLHRAPYYRTCYKYASGNKEVWQCREFVSKGKEGCNAPVLYTDEMDDILRSFFALWEIGKEEIIGDLIRLYSCTGSTSGRKEEMVKIEREIEIILKRKDKLLDLNIQGKVSDEEFQLRNVRFNQEIDDCNGKWERLYRQGQQNKKRCCSDELLRDYIAEALEFRSGFDKHLVEALLERAEVCVSEGKNELSVKVFFKMLQQPVDFIIQRRRRNPSVCTAHYI